jgi:large subunit ribosomal protein L32
MGVPKKRHSKSKVGRRRMHIFLKEPNLVKCPKCGHFVLPHRVCSYCGYYREKEVINVLEKLEKEEKKKREKELKEKEKRPKTLSWKELSKKHGI